MKTILNILAEGLFPSLLALALVLPTARAAEIHVFAAASLTDSLQAIAKEYGAKSGDTIIFNFAGSNVLARQIMQGAPADLFFSADEAQMDNLTKAGLIVEKSRRDILANSLVIVVHRDNPAVSLQPSDLAKPEIHRIALADPQAVPAGVYAKAWLQKIALWDQIASKIVPTENVRAALAAVESGNVDAGIVYKSDATISKLSKVVHEIPSAEGPPILYPAALIQNAAHLEAAQKFLDYLSSPAASQIFAKYGLAAKGS
jgi:molybdate transport system substrate-binding protein